MVRHKRANDIGLILESGRWCSYAHRLLQEYTRAGATEAEVSLRVAQEATLAMLAEPFGQLGSADGVKAGYRGQIGSRSSWAHAIAPHNQVSPGDPPVRRDGGPAFGG